MNGFITLKELMADLDNWHTTENLDLDFFDDIDKELGSPYYLKKKDSDAVYYGQYVPKSKDFDCYMLGSLERSIIKREEVSSFLSLPPLNYDFNNIHRSWE